MEIRIFDDKQSLGVEAAQSAAELMRAAQRERGNAGEGWFPGIDDVPKQAISMSIRQMLKSRAILCIVPELRKAPAVKATLSEPVSPAVPASILRTHPNATLFLDRESASLLSDSDPH